MFPINIYFNSVKITLEKTESSPEQTGFLKIENEGDLRQFLDRYFAEKNPKNASLFGDDPQLLFRNFRKNFTYLEAAGGLVHNQHHQFLFIKRFGMWDLPKGKIEKAETAKSAALREVMEETGINDLTIIKKLSPTYHIYANNNKRILKKTHWFSMETPSEGSPKPEKEEGITEVVWLNRDQSIATLHKSYLSLKDNFISLF